MATLNRGSVSSLALALGFALTGCVSPMEESSSTQQGQEIEPGSEEEQGPDEGGPGGYQQGGPGGYQQGGPGGYEQGGPGGYQQGGPGGYEQGGPGGYEQGGPGGYEQGGPGGYEQGGPGGYEQGGPGPYEQGGPGGYEQGGPGPYQQGPYPPGGIYAPTYGVYGTPGIVCDAFGNCFGHSEYGYGRSTYYSTQTGTYCDLYGCVSW